MKKTAILFFGLLFMAACSDSGDEPDGGNGALPPDDSPKWHLEWSDDFNGTEIDSRNWSRTERGTPDWAKTQSDDPRCLELADGILKLKGIVNDDLTKDPSPYLCGGIWSKDKKAFGPGCIQVKARLGNGAQGAWPAIWLMPFAQNGEDWPDCGEIDIMERLNHESQVYQTVHSRYVTTLGIKNPANSKTTSVNPDNFNIYEVQIWENEVKFYINNNLTMSYPKIDGGADGQFPFYKEWYLIIDMQLGGSWVGSVDSAQLPVEMEVDWVRYYRYY